jgi:hypothetical protein
MAAAQPLPSSDRVALTATSIYLSGVFLALTAVSLTTVERLKYLILADRSAATPARLLAALHASDLALVAIGAACGLGVLVLELRRRGLSRLLSGEAPLPLALAMAAMLLWFAHALLAPGLIVTGDGGTHVTRVNHLAMAIRDGSSLYWDNFFFAGGTLLQFTGPVFHWFATAITLAVGDATTGVKIAAVACRVAAALAMFAFLRRAVPGLDPGISRTAAALGSLFFAGSFYVTYLASIRSTFPLIFVLATLPAMLYGIECVLAAPRSAGRGWIVLCLAAIALIGDHPPTAVMAAVLFGLYVLARIAMAGWRLAPLPPLLLAAAVIALGSSYFLVPFALEQKWTAEGALNQPLLSLVWPRPGELLNYVVWGRAGTGPVYTAYVGLSIIACALAGAPLALRAPRGPAARLWLIAAALAVLSLFLAGLYVRPSGFTFTFLCIAAAASVQLLHQAFPARTWIPALIFAAFVFDVAPSALQPFTRTDMRGIEQAGKVLAERAANERVLQVTPGDEFLLSVGPNSTPLHYARVQMLHGPHKPDATRAHNGIVAALDLVADDLAANDRLSSQSRTLLGMLNVGWVVGVDGPRMGLPPRFADTIADAVLGPYWRLPEATPVLASGRFELAERPAAFDAAPFWNGGFSAPAGRAAKAAVVALVGRMGVDLAHRQAAAFLVAARPVGPPWPAAAAPAPAIELTDYSVEPGRVRLTVTADRAGLLRLAHPIYPTVTVLRNGEPVAVVGDVFSFIVLPIEAGRNDIEVTASPSVLRRVCLAITAATVVGLLALLGFRRRRSPDGTE